MCALVDEQMSHGQGEVGCWGWIGCWITVLQCMFWSDGLVSVCSFLVSMGQQGSSAMICLWWMLKICFWLPWDQEALSESLACIIWPLNLCSWIGAPAWCHMNLLWFDNNAWYASSHVDMIPMEFGSNHIQLIRLILNCFWFESLDFSKFIDTALRNAPWFWLLLICNPVCFQLHQNSAHAIWSIGD